MARFRYLIVGGAAAVALLGAWALLPSSGATASVLSRLSSRGTTVALPAYDARTTRLRVAGFTRVSRLATRGARSFYRLENANGNDCFGSGAAGAVWPLGTVKCRIAAPYFPSAELPVLDVSEIGTDRGASTPEYLRIRGFAADGVASIGALDENGRTIGTVAVNSNVYSATAPAHTVRLVALDADDQVIARVG